MYISQFGGIETKNGVLNKVFNVNIPTILEEGTYSLFKDGNVKLEMESDTIIIPQDDFLHYCDLCKFLSMERKDLIEHIDKKHEGAVFVCWTCNAQLKLRSDIWEHNKSHELTDQNNYPINAWLCRICGNGYSSEISLKVNQKNSHEEEKAEALHDENKIDNSEEVVERLTAQCESPNEVIDQSVSLETCDVAVEDNVDRKDDVMENMETLETVHHEGGKD
jgi:hypothetical protein